MSEVVDAIVAELIVRDVDRYEKNFDRATAAHGRFLKSGKQLETFAFDLNKEGQKYKAGADKIAQAEEQTAAKVTRSRKARADSVIAQDEREVRSAKANAKARADAEIAEAQRSARIRAGIDRGVARSTVTPGTGANFGRSIPRQGDGGQAFMSGTKVAGGAAAEAAAPAGAEKEINHLLADQAALQSRLSSARGADRAIIKDQLGELRLIGQLQRAGLTDAEIALRLDQRRLLVEAERGRVTKANLLAGASKTGGNLAAGAAGLLTVASAGIAVATIQSAVDYGKALSNLSDQLGITVEDLQAYQKLGRDAGVSTEQLSSAFGQFASNLGRAKQGEQEQSKVFKALGVDITKFASAGDALPTIIDRISSIADPAQRAAIETRLFGESGRKLDALLSGGAARVSELAASLQETGRALSAKEIQELDRTARELAAVKAQLQVDFAQIVAGNAGAIIGLANSFAQLSARIIDTIGKLQQFGAQQISTGFLSNFASGDQKAFARQFQLGTPAGRATLRKENTAALDKALGLNASNRNSPEAARLLQALSSGSGPGASPRQAEVRRLLRERGEIQAAERGTAAATTPAVQAGRVNAGALRNLGTPAGPKGKSAEQLAKEADQRQRRYEEELDRATQDFLQAQRNLTGSVERRFEIDKQMLDAALAHRKQEIQREANEKQIDESRVKELQAAEDAAYQANLAVLEMEKRVQLESDANSLRQQALQSEVDILSLQEGLAVTAKERAALAAQRLEAERRAESASLAAIITSKDTSVTEADRRKAIAQFETQDVRFGAKAEQERRNNEGPFAAYRRRLNRSPGQLSEDAESLVVAELESVHDGIAGALKKAIGTDDPLISGLIDMFIDQVILKPLANALSKNGGGVDGFASAIAGLFGGGGGGKSLSGLASKIGSAGIAPGDDHGASSDFANVLASLGSIFGARASGGNVVGGGRYLVGENGPEVVQFGQSGRVYPNGALPNVRGGSGGLTVVAPQHFDLTGVVMTEPLLRQFEARNREYANAVARAAASGAVAATPGRLQQIQTLER